jgi:ankyrin repeat protein
MKISKILLTGIILVASYAEISAMDWLDNPDLPGVHISLDLYRLFGNPDVQLFDAIQKGDEALVIKSIEQNANVNCRKGIVGMTPLMRAIHNKYDAIVKILLKHNANINAQDKYNKTALHLAVSYDCASYNTVAIIQLLLEEGAKVDIADQFGATPLYEAAHDGSLEIVKMLLAYGANANIQASEYENQTALMSKHFEVVEALLTSISNADAPAMRDSYFALHRSMGRHGMKASKDVRKLVADRFIDALVQERIEKVVRPMIAIQDSNGRTARDRAVTENHSAIADLLNLDNPESREKIRKMIKTNIWHAVSLRTKKG